MTTMFQQLRRLQAFNQKHFPCLQSHLDSKIIVEIGYCQEQGRPLTIKAVFQLADDALMP